MAVQITGSQIKNLAITSGKIAADSIDATKIADDAVTAAAIADGQIGAVALNTGAVTNTKIFAAAVTPVKADLTQTWDFSSGTLRANTPSASNDVTTKDYVDSAVSADIYWKKPCRVATTANITLNSAPATIDGITLVSNDRVLVKDQTTNTQNGIYVFAGTGNALSRSSDADSAADLNGAASFIAEGSVNADHGFTQTGEVTSIGTSAITWVQFTGLGQITAGAGLSKTGSTLNVETGNGISIVSDAVVVNASTGLVFASGALKVSIDDSTIGLNGSDQIIIKDDGITTSKYGPASIDNAAMANLSVDSGNLIDGAVLETKLGASSISSAKIQAGAITEAKIFNNSVTASKIDSAVAGDGLAGGNGSALSVNVDDATIQIAGDTLEVKGLGIGSSQIANSAITSAKISGGAVGAVKLGADVAGDGIALDAGSNALGVDLATVSGLEISTQKLKLKLNVNKGLLMDSNGLLIDIDANSMNFDSGSGQLQVKPLGIAAAQLASNAVETIKIADDAVTFAKAGFRMYQELNSVSGGTTTFIDLGRELDANAVNGVMIYKNGLCMLNRSAIGGSAANSDEFTVSPNGGAGSVARLTFGAALADGDNVLCWYLT